MSLPNLFYNSSNYCLYPSIAYSNSYDIWMKYRFFSSRIVKISLSSLGSENLSSSSKKSSGKSIKSSAINYSNFLSQSESVMVSLLRDYCYSPGFF
jgi:hypothetical protein